MLHQGKAEPVVFHSSLLFYSHYLLLLVIVHISLCVLILDNIEYSTFYLKPGTPDSTNKLIKYSSYLLEQG